MNTNIVKSNKKTFAKGYHSVYKTEPKNSVYLKQDPQVKFKTEFCRNLESGVCEFGDKCFFAHSIEELRNKNSIGTLKHTKCKNFFEFGYCICGPQCQYSHRDKSPETAANSPSTSIKPSRKGSEDRHKIPIFIDLEYRSLF
jgi:hypothetical protein